MEAGEGRDRIVRHQECRVLEDQNVAADGSAQQIDRRRCRGHGRPQLHTIIQLPARAIFDRFRQVTFLRGQDPDASRNVPKGVGIFRWEPLA